MNRLTKLSEITGVSMPIELIESCGESSCLEICEDYVYNDCIDCPVQKCMSKLAAYEDTGLEPEEVKTNEEMFKAYRHVCGGRPPEEIKKALELLDLEEQGLLIKLPMQLGELVLELQDNILEKRGIFIDYGSLNAVLETLQETEDN